MMLGGPNGRGCMRRSSARNDKRMEALRECVRMITASAGGCTTPFPFEAAIWLLEEQEELYGGALPVYRSVRTWNANAWSALSNYSVFISECAWLT